MPPPLNPLSAMAMTRSVTKTSHAISTASSTSMTTDRQEAGTRAPHLGHR